MVQPSISPEFIRKLQESLQSKVDEIRNLGQKLNSTSPATGNIKHNETITKQTNVETATESNNDSVTVDNDSVDNSTTDNHDNTTIKSVSQRSNETNTVLNGSTVPDHSTVSQPTESHNNDNTLPTTDDKTGTEEKNSGVVIIQESNNTTDTKNIDITIFSSSGLDAKQRKQDIKNFCRKIDFGEISKGFQCCKKTLNCFDELPENLDETIFHHGNANYNEAERIHVCHHIDEALLCHGEVLSRAGCQKAQTMLEEKITPQLNKVKLFYYNNCNRGSPPTGGIHPAHPSLQPNSSVPFIPGNNVPGRADNETGDQARSYAPFIGGAIMGVFALIVLIIFALYCRKRSNKKKKSKEKSRQNSQESQQSSRYKTVSYSRRKSDVYAEIDEKSMISSVSYGIDGHHCSNDGSCGSRKLPSAPDKKLEVDNHGYLSPRSSWTEDQSKPDISNSNLFTHGYIELKSESGESAQSYAKLEPEPEEDYIQPDKIQSSPSKKKSDEQNHMYFVLEKENREKFKDFTDIKY